MESLVSIVVPSYNRAHLIGETIQSIIDQSFNNWELIIVDDGSTDDTKKQVEEFNDDRIRYHAIEHCGIIGKVRNHGMEQAQGEYIAFLDSDDLWLPHKLDYQLSLIKEYPQASFVFGHGEHFGIGATPTPELEKHFEGNVFLPFLFEQRFIFYVPTLLFKKEILSRIKSIDESLFYAGDIDFFLRIAYSFDGIFSNRIVAKIRKQERSHSQNNEMEAYDEYLTMLKKHFQENRLTCEQYVQVASNYHYRTGLLYLKLNESKRAKREFQSHLHLTPLNCKGWIRFVQSLLASL